MSELKLTDDYKKEVMESNVPVLLEFGASWCGPCKVMAPLLDEIEKELAGKAKVLTVDIESPNPLIAKYGIKSVPTIVIINGGEVQEKIVGSHNKKFLVDALSKYIEKAD